MVCRSWTLVCLAAILAGLSLVMAADPPAPTAIHKTAAPIQIDGVLDEPAWQKAQAIDVNYIWGKVGEKSTEPRMTVKYTWDDNYLYIGYETFDKNLVALGSGEKQGPKGNEREVCVIGHPTEKVDVVEFFISFGDQRFFWELHHNAANHFSDIWCVVVDDLGPISKSSLNRFGIQFNTREIVQDDTDAGHTLASAIRLKPKADGKPSTINDSSDTDTGYVGELRLPWLGLGAPLDRESYIPAPNDPKKRIHGPWKMAGQEMMILAVCQDGDTKEHYFHSSPTKPGGWFHKGSDLWPRYRLEDAAGKK